MRSDAAPQGSWYARRSGIATAAARAVADARALLAGPSTRPLWLLLGLRSLFWGLTVLALLWSPLRRGFPRFLAYGPHSDLAFGAFAHWDAEWFLSIVNHGYRTVDATAFFPGFPLVTKTVSFVVGSPLVAGVLVSLAAAGIAAVLLHRISTPVIGMAGATDAVLLLALYPCAFVFTAAYSDALFLALVTGSFLAGTKRRPWLAAVCAAAAVATRLAGLALVPPLLLLLRPQTRSFRDTLRPVPAIVLPLAVLGGYMVYLHERFGDAFAFAHVLDVHWHRHIETLGPLGGLFHSVSSGWQGGVELVRHLPAGTGTPHGFPSRDQLATWNVLQLLVLVGVLWLTWVAWRRLGPALGLYAVSMDVVLLSNTVDVVPLMSFPRYVLGNFPVFIALAAELRGRPRAREVVLIGFAALGAVAAVAFARGTWIA